MRIRFEKKKKREVELRVVSTAKFAWIPTKLSNGTWVWLEKYRMGEFRSVRARRRANVDPADYSNVIELVELRDAR